MNLLIQLVIFLVTYLFIYHQVFNKTDLSSLLLRMESDLAKPEFQTGLLLVMTLMLVNWSVEAFKWKYLIGKVEEVTFFKAYQAVLTGISISSFIPNRVGEFFGRIYILKTASRIEGILITVVGSMSQLLITILAGTAALLIFIPKYLSGSGFGHGYLYDSVVILVIALDVILLSMFFKLSFLSTLKERIL